MRWQDKVGYFVYTVIRLVITAFAVWFMLINCTIYVETEIITATIEKLSPYTYQRITYSNSQRTTEKAS